MIFGLTAGQRVTKKASVSTSAVTLHTATDKLSLSIESITICNTNAAARTFSLYTDNGSSQFYVFNDHAIVSKATIQIENHPIHLTRGESLKAIASGAGIHITACIIQSTPVDAAPPQSTLSTLSRVSNRPGGV